ncbi:hypothetical protein [Sphingobium mellinum]|uniref:hypothetical protein n=1 Tax=Sphingobium mellinum TaxID=1387166 RepID=UPI0030EF0701
MKKIIAALILMAAMPATGQAQSAASADSRGDYNRILIDQSAANGAQVDIDQVGDNNMITLQQIAGGQRGSMRLEGAGHQVQAVQQGPGDNSLALWVEGNANSSNLDQSAFAGGSNVMTIGQWGDRNSAQVTQTALAGANSLYLQQNGNDNFAGLAQNGDNNSLSLTQNGDSNSATLSQNGTGLGLSLTQWGGASISVTQTAP